MYDLPSEDPQEPGLPDDFHYYQPHLLQETFRPAGYPPELVYAAGDVNLYYDLAHPLWHKRPDWYAVLGVPRLYEGRDLRLSYVIWQEGVSPFVIVELLSPGTEKEDLGKAPHAVAEDEERPPSKWEVYEQILKVPYYVTYDRYQDRMRAFVLEPGGYRALPESTRRVWMSEIALGIGIWEGVYRGIRHKWLRWYGEDGAWMPTEAEVERQRAATERQRADRLADRLRVLGIDPE